MASPQSHKKGAGGDREQRGFIKEERKKRFGKITNIQTL